MLECPPNTTAASPRSVAEGDAASDDGVLDNANDPAKTQLLEVSKGRHGMSYRRVLVLSTLLVLFFLYGTATAAGSAGAFTGAWTATDPDDGSTLKLQIGAPNAFGVSRVTLMDQFASACGALATAIGSGTVSSMTLSSTLDIRCGGSPFAADVPVTFDAVGDTLLGFGVVWTRMGG
jgi:hypothetical protein